MANFSVKTRQEVDFEYKQRAIKFPECLAIPPDDQKTCLEDKGLVVSDVGT